MKIAGTVAEGDEVAGFEVLHFPGHAPGLIGLWRESDRVALVSDVVYLVDSARLKPLPEGEASVPHPAWAWDHEQAKESVRKLAALEPRRGRAPATSGRCAARACARRWSAPPRSSERGALSKCHKLPTLMIGTYASAALICAASLLVGRAVLSLAGRRCWSWLEPAVGFAAILAVPACWRGRPGTGPAPPSASSALLVVAALRRLAAALRGAGGLRAGLPVAIAVALVLAIPFAVSGRWGLLGVGFNNDLGLHLAWAEWLRSGFGPAPDTGYPLGPHGLAAATAAFPGIGLGQAFVGEIVAIGVLTGLTALGAAGRDAAGAAAAGGDAGRRPLPRRLLLRPGRLQGDRRGALRPRLRDLPHDHSSDPEAPPRRARQQEPADTQPRVSERCLGALPAAAAGPGRRHLLLLQLRRARLAGGDAGALEPDPAGGAAGAAAAGAAALPAAAATLLVIAVLAAAGVATLVGPFGFASSFNKVAGSNTYGPVSPVEALGVWPASNYRLDAVGGAQLPGLAGAIAVLALLVGVAWWVRRREATIPIALGACAVLYLASLPFSGDYSQAKALMIAAPLAMLVAVKPLLWEFPAGVAELSRRWRQKALPREEGRGGGIRRAAGGGRRWAGRVGGAGGGLRRRRRLLELPGPARRAGRAAGARG